MNKKLLSILMCLIMLVSPMLASCGNNTNPADTSETGDSVSTTEKTDRTPMTLSLWLPTDKSTTEEAVKLVENEINKLTQIKYNTAIELHAVDRDEYQEVIDKKLSDIDNVKNNTAAAAESERLKKLQNAINGILPGEEVETEAVSGEETVETEINEYGQSVDVYPAVADDQLDIFLVKGYDKYKEYSDSGLIEALDEQLNANAKKLKSYVYPTFLKMANINGTYGIPNNHALGEYQLLLVNKELAKQYDYNADELTTLLDCENFIKDIGSQNIAGVTPLLGECEAANMYYFSSDGKWSVFANQIVDKDLDNVYYETFQIAPRGIFEIESYGKTYTMMRELKAAGYVGDGKIDNGEKFAVGVISGDGSLIDEYSEDYYVYTHAIPVADYDDVFESVFSVSSHTKDVARSAEIITYLNTDQEIRTILQYGVEGVHWESDTSGDEDVIHLLNHDYSMDIVETGNIFLTYPGDGIPMSYWDNLKQQNLDSATNRYAGFEYLTEDNKAYMDKMAAVSADVYSRLENSSVDQLPSTIRAISGELLENNDFNSLLSKEASEDLTDTLMILFESHIK